MQDDERVLFATPNIVHDFQRMFTPNDPLFGNQWHLDNTGQTGGTVGADANLVDAWDITTGSSDIVIAVIDDGVQTSHPDLNAWTNPGEIAGNGIDDDGNGWIDDVNGFDFRDNDSNANPTDAQSNHGTSVAGVAGAIGNNSLGVSGASQQSQIMAVKISKGNNDFATSADIASAVYYAAGRTEDGTGTWDSADVLNNSWGGGGFDTVIDTAFNWAANNGRGGLGAVSLAATGNSAGGFLNFSLGGIPAGNWIFEWRYSKDGSVSAGDDTVWLSNVGLPDGTFERFDTPGSLPAGWSTSGDASWTTVDDPAHSHGTGRYVAQSGNISDNQQTALRSSTISVASTQSLTYSAWVSSEAGFDFFEVYASNDGGASFSGPFIPFAGVPFVSTPVSYPANSSFTIGVGASTDFDFRSDYSQYGAGLDIVAPSNGGNAAIRTTDRTGSDGYDATSDYALFGGTSSATPLAAGVAALLLAQDPTLTFNQVRQILRDSADKIGGNDGLAAYNASGFNQFYGYGRINAEAALMEIGEIPQVEGVVINGGDDTRSKVNSLTVTFDAEVDHAALHSAFTVTNITTSTQVGTVHVTPTDSGGQTTAELTFSGASTLAPINGTLGTTLLDGNYRLDIWGAQVQLASDNSVTMPTDYLFGNQVKADTNNDNFYRWYGDDNGDGLTNFGDFSTGLLPSMFSGIGDPAYDEAFDATGDGLVNFGDFSSAFLPKFDTSRP